MEIISYLCNKKSYEVYEKKLVNSETRLEKLVRKLGDQIIIFTLTSDILFKLYENIENKAFNNAKSYSDKSLNLKDYQFEKTITVEYVMGKFNACTIIQKSLNELQNLNLDFLFGLVVVVFIKVKYLTSLDMVLYHSIMVIILEPWRPPRFLGSLPCITSNRIYTNLKQ